MWAGTLFRLRLFFMRLGKVDGWRKKGWDGVCNFEYFLILDWCAYGVYWKGRKSWLRRYENCARIEREWKGYKGIVQLLSHLFLQKPLFVGLLGLVIQWSAQSSWPCNGWESTVLLNISFGWNAWDFFLVWGLSNNRFNRFKKDKGLGREVHASSVSPFRWRKPPLPSFLPLSEGSRAIRCWRMTIIVNLHILHKMAQVL
jgi:hypothetical protein